MNNRSTDNTLAIILDLVKEDSSVRVLTFSRNFGYQFTHWANDLDQIVSTSNPYTFTLNNNLN